MRDILLLDCYEIGCPKVLLYAFIEFCQYFKENNYSVKIIQNIKDITNYSIVFMGDTIRCDNASDLLNKQAPEAIYIGWYWHNQNTDSIKYFIYTYENMLEPDKRVQIIKTKKNNIPFLLRSSEDPCKIGKFKKIIVYDYCYMGWRYCPHLVPYDKFTGIYHGVVDANKFLKYEERKNIYLSSKFALGFQSNENISNKHVSQRIFEGLTYGCIVLTNSIPACEQTNNIAVFVKSKEDVENYIKYYLENPSIMQKKQQDGYEFAKKYGTNRYAVNFFIDKIKEYFDIIV
jgi:hypothetical protein